MSCHRYSPSNGDTDENRTPTTLRDRTKNPALERAMVTIAHQDNVLQPLNKMSFTSPLQPYQYMYLTLYGNVCVADWCHLFLCLLLMVTATLCKEQGITVVGVCCLYELFIVQRLRVGEMWPIAQGLLSSGKCPLWLREMALRLGVLASGAACLLVARVWVMGAQPVFTKFDNPAAAAEFPARHLTYAFLLPLNAWLLLFPWHLCCDWTMGTVLLVESVADPRNGTLPVYRCAGGYKTDFGLAILCITDHQSQPKFSFIPVTQGLALLVLPFLPASNVFFPVGFVVAERVLYSPSMGFCLLVAYGAQLLGERLGSLQRYLLPWAFLLLLSLHALRTFVRNWDWESEHTIFMAGLKVNQNNAKLYNNVGHALESQGQFEQALEYFLKASEVQPDDMGAHINVGRTYNNLQRYEEAEAAFRRAKSLLPHPRPGEPYHSRMAPNHLNVFLNLANLISRNNTRLEEADALYRQAISMRADYIEAYINRGDILIKLNNLAPEAPEHISACIKCTKQDIWERLLLIIKQLKEHELMEFMIRTREAQNVYERALQFDKVNPDIYYNLGVVFLEQGKAAQALQYFDKALKLNPQHEQALMNSAILIQESGNPGLRQVAYDRLHQLLDQGKASERVFFNLGMLAMDDKEMDLAESWFKKAIQLREDFRSALFNLALLLSDLRRPLEAVPFLRQLLQHHPDHIKGLILLGDILVNHIKDLDSAQECYEKILALEPTNVQALHNLCVVFVERGVLNQAEQCLTRAVALAPNEVYIQKHLRIVQARFHRLRQANLTTAPTAAHR
ncbi:TMTC3 [Cordylochernes scorpioides]|uniref:dolichyl-phosphate-mannose--protein mannosyltransferase n=1 Tax=Cordylochernes scorpioides TaxID=51811 RepID=A0ABY6KPL1_9ARAC|nr:TMTC3 [Cordylochernes scorpioides]